MRMIMTGLTPLMFAAKKPAAKAPAAKQAPAPKPIAEDNPLMLKKDTPENREKAARFLFEVLPSDHPKVKELKKVVGDNVLQEFIDFFKDSGDYHLSGIKNMIRLVQSSVTVVQQKAVSELVSIAREMGYSLEQD